VTKLERNTIGSVATLQECFDKLGRYGSCTLSRRSIQMAPIRTGSHPACGRVVPAFFTVLPRRRRTLGRTRDFGRSRQALALSCSAMRRNWSGACVKGSRQQTILGGSTLTYVRVKSKWVYLYRAVDSEGALDRLFTLEPNATQPPPSAFRAKALGGENHPAPRVINTDKHAGYPPAIVELKIDGVLEEKCRHRPVQYLGVTSWNRITGRSSAGCAQANILAPFGKLGARRAG
jgi:DDE domain